MEYSPTWQTDSPAVSGTRRKPSVSVIVPAYNEAGLLPGNYEILREYLETLSGQYEWELLFVNDGSADETGALLDAIQAKDDRVRVIHHLKNRGLSEALQTGFANCQSDYAVTLDIDLSYSPDHVGRLLERIAGSQAQVVLASPYMKGGEVSNVPWKRHQMSYWANRFLSFVSPERLSTFTGMVRAYDMHHLKGVDLKAKGMDINPEIIYKTLLLRGRVEEIPAHLDWGPLRKAEKPRKSSMQVPWHTLAILFSGFVFRPFMFFLAPGVILSGFAAYMAAWTLTHISTEYRGLTSAGFEDRLSHAVELAYQHHGHTFFVTGLLLMLAAQFLSLGVLSMQNKRYFEESFHLGTSIYRQSLH